MLTLDQAVASHSTSYICPASSGASTPYFFSGLSRSSPADLTSAPTSSAVAVFPAPSTKCSELASAPLWYDSCTMTPSLAMSRQSRLVSSRWCRAAALARSAARRSCTSGASTSHSPDPGPRRCVPRRKYASPCETRSRTTHDATATVAKTTTNFCVFMHQPPIAHDTRA